MKAPTSWESGAVAGKILKAFVKAMVKEGPTADLGNLELVQDDGTEWAAAVDRDATLASLVRPDGLIRVAAARRLLGRRAYGRDRWTSECPTWGLVDDDECSLRRRQEDEDLKLEDLLREKRYAAAVDAILENRLFWRSTSVCAALRASGRYTMAFAVAKDKTDESACVAERASREDGDRYASEGDWARAAFAYARSPSSPSLSLLAASASFRAGNLVEAMERFKLAAELHPEDPLPKVWALRSRCQLFLNDATHLNGLARAAAAIDEAIEELKDDVAFFVAAKANVEAQRRRIWDSQNHLRRTRLYGHDYYQRKKDFPEDAPIQLEEEDDLSDAYVILGLSERNKATQDDIKVAYRRKLLETHPDKKRTDDANAQFLAVQDAFATLSNPTLRAHLDDQDLNHDRRRRRQRSR